MSSRVKQFLTISRKISITAIGGILVVGGLLLFFLPGPGIIVLLGGLALLASEYSWAKKWLEQVRARFKQVSDRLRNQ